jgi:ATP-dependent exoDNAse (exonuclease V) alpha subunit
MTFKAKFIGIEYHKDTFIKSCPSPENLKLKIGASVMVTSNLDTKKGIVNGTMGVVTSFSSEGPVVKTALGVIVVKENTWEIKEQAIDQNGILKYNTVASWIQIPLRIAFAVTVHKTQGLTIDRAILDLERTFSAGQIYVALSRVRNLESLSISNLPIDRIIANKDCLNFYKHAT